MSLRITGEDNASVCCCRNTWYLRHHASNLHRHVIYTVTHDVIIPVLMWVWEELSSLPKITPYYIVEPTLNPVYMILKFILFKKNHMLNIFQMHFVCLSNVFNVSRT